MTALVACLVAGLLVLAHLAAFALALFLGVIVVYHIVGLWLYAL